MARAHFDFFIVKFFAGTAAADFDFDFAIAMADGDDLSACSSACDEFTDFDLAINGGGELDLLNFTV
jgi:hypothetical protein